MARKVKNLKGKKAAASAVAAVVGAGSQAVQGSASSSPSPPPTQAQGKKRKREVGDEGQQQANAPTNGLESPGAAGAWRTKAVTKLSDFPRNMVKYWHARYNLFDRYDSGILLDLESWYSVTPEAIAARTAARCACDVVLDVFAGCGGNSIQFAMTCKRVVAVEIDPVKVEMARHNARVYGVEDRIDFVTGDGVQFLRDVIDGKAANKTALHSLPFDVVFLSPPWGGVSYSKPAKSAPCAQSPASSSSPQHPPPSTSPALRRPHHYPLANLTPLSGQDLYALARRVTPNVSMFLPRNCDLNEIAALDAAEIDVEEQWLGDALKALSVYFGELAGEDKWQGHRGGGEGAGQT